jgi:hypothetical protein
MFCLFFFSLQDAQRMGFAGLLRALASGMEARVSAANEQAARLFFFVFLGVLPANQEAARFGV